MKPHLCNQCGDKNPENFYPTQKSLCKKCTIARSKLNKEPNQPRITKPHKCRYCGEADPDQFYPANKSRCKKCAIVYQRERVASLPEEELLRLKERQAVWQDSNMLRFRWKSAMHRAIKKNIEFTISEQYLQELLEVQQGKCYYTGRNMIHARDNNRRSVSIDRLDSTKGYVEGNVVLCCADVNIMKNDLSLDEFKSLIATLFDNIDSF